MKAGSWQADVWSELKALPVNSCLVPALVLIVNRHLATPLLIVLLWWLTCNLYLFSCQLHTSRRNIVDARTAIETLAVTHFLVEAEAEDLFGSKDFHMFANTVKVIQAVPRGLLSPPIEKLKSFLTRGEYSVILINGIAKPLKPFQKFVVYHEIGHTAFAGSLGTAVTKHAANEALVFFLPCFFFCNWHGAIVLLVFALSQVVLLRGGYKVELMADAFALEKIAGEDGLPLATHVLDLVQMRHNRSFAGAKTLALRKEAHVRSLYLARVREAWSKGQVTQLGSKNLAFWFFGLPWFLIHLATIALLLHDPRVPSHNDLVVSESTVMLSLVFATFQFISFESAAQITTKSILQRTWAVPNFEWYLSSVRPESRGHDEPKL